MSHESPEPLDYGQPDRLRLPWGLLIWMTIGCVLPVSILSILLGWTLPRYEQLFADMKLSPPAMTALVLWIGRQFRSYGWVLIWLIPLSPASLMFWKASKITSQDELQRFGKRLSMAVYVLVVGGFVLAVMALLVPMVQTFDTLTK